VNAEYVNAAIAPRSSAAALNARDNQTLTFYCWKLNADGSLAPELKQYPAFLTQICSLSRDRLWKNPYDTLPLNIPESTANAFILSVDVTALTVANLMRRYVIRPRDVSFVICDTEGYDAEVMAQLPFDDECFRPRLVVYEHVLLSKQQLTEIAGRFSAKGYEQVSFTMGAQGYYKPMKLGRGKKIMVEYLIQNSAWVPRADAPGVPARCFEN
jgi:hypothetical protein